MIKGKTLLKILAVSAGIGAITAITIVFIKKRKE